MSALAQVIGQVDGEGAIPGARAPGERPLRASGWSDLFGFARLPWPTQRKGLLVVLSLGLALAALGAWLGFAGARDNAARIESVGELRLLVERLGRSAQLSMQGQVGAIVDLAIARDEFNEIVSTLRDGGKVVDRSIPALSSGSEQAQEALEKAWIDPKQQIDNVLKPLAGMLSIIQSVARIRAIENEVVAAGEAWVQAKADSGASAKEMALAARLLVRLSDLAGATMNLLSGEGAGSADVAGIQRTVESIDELFQRVVAAAKGAKASDPESASFRELARVAQPLLNAARVIVGNAASYAQARAAGARLIGAVPALTERVQGLDDTLSRGLGGGFVGLAVLAGVLIVGSLVGLIHLSQRDNERRRQDAEALGVQAQTEKDKAQQAILRLMNEMGDLADGDLTVRATVTEDITGAIADSVNYTIEELAVLVRRINAAAGRLAEAAETSVRLSNELSHASEQQALEIRSAGQAVLQMAKAMRTVSSEAMRAAQVARGALAAADKGAQAATDSLHGMNEIRGQIQETAKRIKRLGESSQEIGEIVELIGSITEQTNVLALNAAIQAASAGEAGRGFSVVAEEVQRLAERSASATQKIAVIVRTIQADTQEAVRAMENSTQGVVDGARLSDAAAQALAEIAAESTELAALIEQMAGATQSEAGHAVGVAESMRRILDVTDRSAAGTRQTAVAIGDLASLATELKGSVAGFKV